MKHAQFMKKMSNYAIVAHKLEKRHKVALMCNDTKTARELEDRMRRLTRRIELTGNKYQKSCENAKSANTIINVVSKKKGATE